MSISPYAMETLYRHGTIDYIPYDALAPVVGSTQSSNFSSGSENLVTKQIEELKRMSQGPITLYPKTSVNNVQNNQYMANNLNSYNSQDSFINSYSPLGEVSNTVVNEMRNIKKQPVGVKSSDELITSGMISEDERQGIIQKRSMSKLLPKALISLGAIGLTLFALFKRPSSSSINWQNVWTKLNPVNWFK